MTSRYFGWSSPIRLPARIILAERLVALINRMGDAWIASRSLPELISDRCPRVEGCVRVWRVTGPPWSAGWGQPRRSGWAIDHPKRIAEGGATAPVGDDDLRDPGLERNERAADLRDHAARDDAVPDQRLGRRLVEGSDRPPLPVEHARRVGQEDEPGSERRSQPAGDLVGVDVADRAVSVERNWGDDRQEPGAVEDPDDLRPRGDDPSDASQLDHALGNEQAGVDAGQADCAHPEALQGYDELGVDDAGENRERHLERRFVGHPPPALEPALHAETGQPVSESPPPAVNDHEVVRSSDVRHAGERVVLLGQRLAAELQDDEGPSTGGHRARPRPAQVL